MPYTSNWTGGLDNKATILTISANYKLTDAEKRRDIIVNATEQNLTLNADATDGDVLLVYNAGDNGVSVTKNDADENGAFVDSGAFVYLIASVGETTFDKITIKE